VNREEWHKREGKKRKKKISSSLPLHVICGPKANPSIRVLWNNRLPKDITGVSLSEENAPYLP